MAVSEREHIRQLLALQKSGEDPNAFILSLQETAQEPVRVAIPQLHFDILTADLEDPLSDAYIRYLDVLKGLDAALEHALEPSPYMPAPEEIDPVTGQVPKPPYALVVEFAAQRVNIISLGLHKIHEEGVSVEQIEAFETRLNEKLVAQRQGELADPMVPQEIDAAHIASYIAHLKAERMRSAELPQLASVNQQVTGGERRLPFVTIASLGRPNGLSRRANNILTRGKRNS